LAALQPIYRPRVAGDRVLDIELLARPPAIAASALRRGGNGRSPFRPLGARVALVRRRSDLADGRRLGIDAARLKTFPCPQTRGPRRANEGGAAQQGHHHALELIFVEYLAETRRRGLILLLRDDSAVHRSVA